MQTEMTETERSPVEVFRALFAEVINRRDADALVPYWSEDIVEHFPTGTVRGVSEVRRWFADTFAAIPDFHIEALDIAGEGEKVFVRWRATGTFSGAPWMGIEPTGTRLELEGFDCFTYRNGRVVENFVVFDQMSFGRQIGMLPPDGSALDRAMRAAFNAQTRARGWFRRK
jgi:predicted ester cyclase